MFLEAKKSTKGHLRQGKGEKEHMITHGKPLSGMIASQQANRSFVLVTDIATIKDAQIEIDKVLKSEEYADKDNYVSMIFSLPQEHPENGVKYGLPANSEKGKNYYFFTLKRKGGGRGISRKDSAVLQGKFLRPLKVLPCSCLRKEKFVKIPNNDKTLELILQGNTATAQILEKYCFNMSNVINSLRDDLLNSKHDLLKKRVKR
jgi:hypothetical protein